MSSVQAVVFEDDLTDGGIQYSAPLDLTYCKLGGFIISHPGGFTTTYTVEYGPPGATEDEWFDSGKDPVEQTDEEVFGISLVDVEFALARVKAVSNGGTGPAKIWGSGK